MKSIFTFIFCVLAAVGLSSLVLAQDQPLTTDEMFRRLGGDPDKARADAAKRALDSPTPEEKESYARAAQMSAILTDDIIANVPSNDPLLLALYKKRLGMVMEGPNPAPWLSVVDRDIRRRPDAKELFKDMLREMKCYKCRAYPLFWLTNNTDVTWGNEIMEEAIKLYRADPNKWESGQIRILCRLIMLRGNESHLDFLDEINAMGIGDNGAARAIRRRLAQAQAAETAQVKSGTLALNNSIASNADRPAQLQEGGGRISLLVGGILVIAVLGMLWWWLKGRK